MQMLPCGLEFVQVLENIGERGRNRTCNLLIKSQVSDLPVGFLTAGTTITYEKRARMDAFSKPLKKLSKSKEV